MAYTQELFAQRINKIRKLKQISVHDCASIIGISKEQFLQLEETAHPLTLPEIMLLSIYFGVPMTAFCEENPHEIEVLSLLDNAIRLNFKRLLHKAISVKLTIEMNKHQITAEDIYQATNIPVDTTLAYQTGNLPIPIDHLLQISTLMDIPVETFLGQNLNFLFNREHNSTNTHWHPEYPEAESFNGKPDDKTLENLFIVLKGLPKEDQAKISKFLLEKLKTL